MSNILYNFFDYWNSMKRLFIISRLIEAIILLIPILLFGLFNDLSIIFCCILILLFEKKTI